jgi:hypothetical protein
VLVQELNPSVFLHDVNPMFLCVQRSHHYPGLFTKVAILKSEGLKENRINLENVLLALANHE